MNYTIAIVTAPQRDFEVSMVKDGNKYIVAASCHHEHEGEGFKAHGNEYASHRYNSIAEAYKMFEQMSRFIVYGLYSNSDRLVMLRNDEYVNIPKEVTV